jgi:hypothetical protein
MRARTWWVLTASAGCLALLSSTSVHAEPKPKAVDIKPIRDELIVLGDADGGTYVVQPGKDGRAWYSIGKGKPFYEQIIFGRYSDGSTGAWDLSVWAPRVPKLQPGSLQRKADGTFVRNCGEDNSVGLSELATDKAKGVLDKGPFMSSAIIRRPYMLARDDAAVYYYVDAIRNEYGGNGYRVFIGKKGAMKQKPLTDIASDTAGDVFATKSGDIRIVRDTVDNSAKSNIAWVKGGKKSALVSLDTDANSVLIYKDLGIYSFIGSICENL